MTDHTNLIARLRLGASISRERKLNLDYAEVATTCADALEALQVKCAMQKGLIDGFLESNKTLQAERDRLAETIGRINLDREQLRAEVVDAKEIQTELQEVITEMCNAIPDYDWSGGAANWITKVFAERDHLRAEVDRLTTEKKAAAMNYEARLTALEGQKPAAWAMKRSDGLLLDIITVEEHARIEGDYTIPLYLAAGAAPPNATQ